MPKKILRGLVQKHVNGEGMVDTMTFNFLKNIFEFLRDVSGSASKLINYNKERKQKKQEELQAWYDKVVGLKESLYKISPISISFEDGVISAVKAYEELQLLIDKYIAEKQGSFSGIKSASEFLNQCGASLKYLHCIYKGKESFETEKFREFYADVYCDFDSMLCWEIGFYNSEVEDDVCPFECHDNSNWFITLQELTGSVA